MSELKINVEAVDSETIADASILKLSIEGEKMETLFLFESLMKFMPTPDQVLEDGKEVWAMGDELELNENHQQGEEGQEVEEADEAKLDISEEELQERVNEAAADPEVLANPTEIASGGVSGGDPSNTSGGEAASTDAPASDPGNTGDNN